MKRIGLLLLLVAVGGCVDREAQRQGERTKEIIGDKTVRVSVVTTKETTVSEELEITGEVQTSSDTTVGAKIPGRLVAVYVQDGDLVRQGQVIAQQETGSLMAQMRQAQGQLGAAQAQLAQAISNKRFGPQRSLSAVKTAEAQLRSARAQLAKAQSGARSEEVRQAEIQVDAAKSNLETARKERDRQLALYKEGASSQQRYEIAENQFQQALSQYEIAIENLRLRRSQTRPEDIESARESVRQAEEALRNAKIAQSLDVNFDEQVAAARAQVSTALAAVDLARQNLADATVRSPFTGRVSGKPTQVGTMVSPGTPIVRLIGEQGIYFEGEVPEGRVAEIMPGREVAVRLDALGGVGFTGRVVAVSPLGESVGRLFKVRIQFEQADPSIKPGMFARGIIKLRTMESAILVPTSAVVTEGQSSHVFILEGGKAKQRPVVKGIERGQDVQITNVRAGEQVVVQGQFQLKDGDPAIVEGQEPSTEKSGK